MNPIYINRDRLVNTFSSLVSLDSKSYNERAVADYLINAYNNIGIELKEDSSASKTGGNCGNLHGMLKGTIDMPPILFCAHMDTVEPSCGKKAIVNDDGSITSDGTTVLGADDVSALSCFLEAAQSIIEQNIPHRPIEFLFTAAEEPYCAGISAMDFDIISSKQAYVFDMSGEVGGAAVQAPTILSFSAEFTGRASHAGFAPENGIHAIKAAANAICNIQIGRIDDTTVNVGTVKGGLQNNIVPQECVFTGEIRSYSDEHAMEHLYKIKSTCERAAAQTGSSVKMTYERHTTAYKTSPADPVVIRFENSCAHLGIPCRLVSTFGGSDNNHLACHGIHGIVPATAMNRTHSCDEFTTIDELETASKLAFLLMSDTEVQ